MCNLSRLKHLLNLETKKVFLIGAGLHNAVVARKLAETGVEVHVFEQKEHIGGGCFDAVDEQTGILYHVYGPHILHFTDKKLLKWLSEYGELIPFHHSVKSVYRDKVYPIPINLDTINSFFKCNLRPFEVEGYMHKICEHIPYPKNMEEQCISQIGRELYEAFFREYTIKQWGRDPRDLPASTIARIPVRANFCTSYYGKPFSCLPFDGFTHLIANIFNHPRININLNTKINLQDVIELSKLGLVVYCGMLDELFDYRDGRLEYRSLYFEKEIINVKDFQGVAVMNYPELKYQWTRVTEPRHFRHRLNLNAEQNQTVILKEFSCEYDGQHNPFYPINDEKNNLLSDRYQMELVRIGNVIPAGRLGSYKYTDMENTINNAMNLVDQIFSIFEKRNSKCGS